MGVNADVGIKSSAPERSPKALHLIRDYPILLELEANGEREPYTYGLTLLLTGDESGE